MTIPTPDDLKTISKSLAALDAIIMQDWELQAGVFALTLEVKKKAPRSFSSPNPLLHDKPREQEIKRKRHAEPPRVTYNQTADFEEKFGCACEVRVASLSQDNH